MWFKEGEQGSLQNMYPRFQPHLLAGINTSALSLVWQAENDGPYDSICFKKGIQIDVPTHVGGGQISATNPLEYTVHTEKVYTLKYIRSTPSV